MNHLTKEVKSLLILAAVIISGCTQGLRGEGPQEYVRKSEGYYRKAESSYRELILKSDNPSQLYLELGKLYYIKGEYALAIEALKNSSVLEAKKFLAISLYRMGNLTGAIEVFNKTDIVDDEYYYYYGLTCERLNLFDQALKAYSKIRLAEFRTLASLRIEDIERKGALRKINKEDPKIAKIISNAPNFKAYPQAGALVLLSKESVEIGHDNTLVSDMHYLVKVLNERGKESFAESLIEYDATFEKIELIYARTIKPDGSVIYVGSRHIRDVSKYMNFPLYSNARVFIISFPDVSLGSVLEYRVKIKRSQLVNKKDFFFSYPIQAYEPIINAEFRISMPKDRDINLKFLNQNYNDFNANFKPEKEDKEQRRNYSWHFKDIPQIIPEPSMPPDVEINPALLISTFTEWQDVYNWWWDLAKDKIKADPAIKTAVKNITKGRLSDLDKARALYNFCAKEIRYVAVEYGQAGYEPHLAADIFRNKYGDCKDQSILLVTMLREAGLKAYPVLIATKSYYNMNEDFPSGIFNHCIAVLYLGDKKIFLDPTAETCSFGDLPQGDQGRTVLVFKDDGFIIEKIPLSASEENLVKQVLKIRVNSDESIEAEKINFTLGGYDQKQRYWLLYTQPEVIRDTIKTIIQDVSIGSKLTSYRIENLDDLNKPVNLRYNFQGPEYFTRAGFLRILPQLASIDTSVVARDNRKYPIDFQLLEKKDLYLEIILPKEYVVKYLPENIAYDSPWFNYSQEYFLKDNKISFRQVKYNKIDKISQKEYAQFKNAIEKVGRLIKQRIILERIER